MTTKEYQQQVKSLIEPIMAPLEVKSEWPAFKGSGYSNHYSLRIDIAVGPFSMAPAPNLSGSYTDLINEDRRNQFLYSVYQRLRTNLSENLINDQHIPSYTTTIEKNQKARCLFAIEIENKNSKKHFIGSLINCASLGRIRIGVAFSESSQRTFIRIINYLSFLKSVGKTYDTGNFLLMTKEQFHEILHDLNR